MAATNEKGDEALGLNISITRRDFLNGALLSAGAVWVADLSPMELLANARQTNSRKAQPSWGGNTTDVFEAGHAVRDGIFDDPNPGAADTGEMFDLVVVGGGFSGLAAAYYFNQAREGRARVLVLENHEIFGGNARRDEFKVKGEMLYAPQGSIVTQDLPPAFAPSPPVDDIFRELKVDFENIRVPKEASAFGAFWDQKSHGVNPTWYVNVFAAPLPADVKRDFLSFIESIMPFYEKPNWKSELERLDKFTFKHYVEKERRWTPALFRLMLPDLVSFFGFPDTVSAAAVYAQYGGGPRALYSFRGGNSGFLRHLIKHLIPEAIGGGLTTEEIVNGPVNFAALDQKDRPVRIRLGSTAVRVEHEGNPETSSSVRVTFSRNGKLYRLRARGVIMAGGGYMTQYVVRDLPSEKREAYSKFHYAPVLWINVALNNSRALDKAGVNFLSTYHDGFGVMLAFYEKMAPADAGRQRNPNRPNVIGIGAPKFYLGMSPKGQALNGRLEMRETSFREYERRIRLELVRLLGPWGFDPRRDIEAIAISRWGHHGYVFPYPGFFTNGAVETAKKPHGRIAFAHTDLERFSHMMGAIGQGHRAVQDILQL
ncbi:MAG TPA: FAD-dependent oxidoreductase [Pyrinomonadaceae bacterium]|nr:FAD-dependent oxidoreductase [Pyrinomonadaceae bacterium]